MAKLIKTEQLVKRIAERSATYRDEALKAQRLSDLKSGTLEGATLEQDAKHFAKLHNEHVTAMNVVIDILGRDVVEKILSELL